MAASRKHRFKEAKKKREGGGFVPMPHVVIRSLSWSKLSPHAIKLLIDLLAQYKGDNNGDLALAWTTMVERGWKSRDTLNKARKELLDEGWIVLARQGGRHQCSLYAVTFYAIDYCKGKLEIQATASPPGCWRKNEPRSPFKVVTRLAGDASDEQHGPRVTKTTSCAN
jgi:hypothetical protein